VMDMHLPILSQSEPREPFGCHECDGLGFRIMRLDGSGDEADLYFEIECSACGGSGVVDWTPENR